MLIEDQPCIKQCTLIEHGEIIASALTKRGVSNAELCAFINNVCEFCGSSKDIGGRTALQIAASCGRTDVCKWLICQKQAKIDERDNESGYTALHRSIFYGKIDTAVSLLKLGANPNILDFNDLTPLEHAMMDNLLPSKPFPTPRQIYMWGSNSNYTLGTQSRSSPEIMDTFHKTYPNVLVKQIYLEKFHTAILTENGEVFTYGIGQGGRLGLGSEKSILEPTLVKFSGDVVIEQASIARDHSLFLSANKEVWVCGSNAHMVLGLLPPPTILLSPRHLSKLKKNISGVCSGRYHSVAWGPKCLYTWGLHAGHLGHDKSEEMHIITPKLVTSLIGDWNIKSVGASYGATVIATDRGDVYVLHEFCCRKIASRHLEIEVVKVIGGRLSIDKTDKADLKVIALTKTRNVLIWQESDPQLSRGIFSLNRLLKIKDVALSVNGMVILTDDRELFKAKLVKRKKQQEKVGKGKGSFHKFLDRSDCIMINLEKISKIHGADTICSDLEGENFASLHVNTATYLTKIPNISPSTIEEDFREFNTNPDISDHTFNIRGHIFTVHKYIIARASPKLKKMMLENDETKLESIHPEIFTQILKYIYTNDCDLLHEGPCSIKISKTIKSSEIVVEEPDENLSAFEVYNKKNKKITKKIEVNDVLLFLQEAAKFLGLTNLQKDASAFVYTNGFITCKEGKRFLPKILKFEHKFLEEFYDVAIESKNGQVIDAHRCILAARSEFFGNMFSVRWGEVPKSELSLQFSQNSLMHLINYLYTDQVNLDNEDLEAVCNLLILAEYLLINRLSEICQFTLSRMLSFKNAFRLLSLSHIYNADQLKVCCMEYICLNLAAGLEARYFEQLEDEILVELTKFYSEWNKKMCTRVITPFSDAANDDIIAEIGRTHPIKMDFEEVIKITPKTNQRKRHRSHKISFSEKTDSKVIESVEACIVEVVPEVEKSVPSRIEAITSALKKISVDKYEENFVTLTKGEFPDLNSSFGSPDGHRFGFKTEKIDKHKMTRISQKTRKRLNSESSNKEVNITLSESPKNPWKIIEPVSPIGSPEVKVNMSAIITEEKKQKENLVKIKSKLLLYTQMEDKAIEELKKFYNVDNVFDEIIVAERVHVGAVATPVWVQK